MPRVHERPLDFESAGGLFPEKVKYFKDQDDAFEYPPYSHVKVTAKCPDCGAEKEITVDKLVHRRYFCPKCTDNMSKPNKTNRAILFQLVENKILKDFDLEYFIPNGNLLGFFDGHIIYNKKEYFIEVHGIQHRDKRSFRHTGEIIEERDKKKADYIEKMPNAELIVIWCDIDNFDYRKKNFIEGYKKIGIDITNLDWKRIEEACSTSLIKEVCDYYNNNLSTPIYKIAEVFKLHSTTITEYLIKGNRLGFCNYDFLSHKAKMAFNKSHAPKVLVYNYDGTELLYIFSTQAEASREMSNMYGKNFNPKTISTSVKNKLRYFGFFFRNINEPLTREEYEEKYGIYRPSKSIQHKDLKRVK